MLDPLMPINPGCNSQTPADQFTSIVDGFWLQEPQTSLLEPKNHKKPTTSLSPIKLSVDCQQLAEPCGLRNDKMGPRLLRCMGGVGSHASWKASTMFVNPGGRDWFTRADRKQDLCSTNQYAVRLLPLCGADPGTSLYQSNMTLMCFYSCLTQPVMNLLAGQDGGDERQDALD